jgi:hypothetical protein
VEFLLRSGELLVVRGQQLLDHCLGIGHHRTKPERQHRHRGSSAI